MQISFNPNYTNNKKSININFKALSAEDIAKYTSDYEMTAKLESKIMEGIIKLDDTDIKKFKELIPDLFAKGEKFVVSVLKDILEYQKKL